MPVTLDLPERIVDFEIGADRIVVENSGDPLQIYDSEVLGISSHLVSEETLGYDHPTPKRRYVDIEFFDNENRVRIVTIDEPSTEGSQLPGYVERVAKTACENTLLELLEQDTVTRKGFTVTDQGMMVTSKGQTVWFALPDLDAFDTSNDVGLVWQHDQALPVATITAEDPNAAVLNLLIPKLVQANAARDPDLADRVPVRQMVDSVECKPPHEQTKKHATFGAAFGLLLAVTGLLLNVFDVFPSLLAIASVTLPIAALVTLFLRKRSKTLLFVYRDGLSIIETRKSGERHASWNELATSTIRFERIEIPTTYRLPNHVFTEVQLKLRCFQSTAGKREQLVTWQLNEETELLTHYLVQKLGAGTPAAN